MKNITIVLQRSELNYLIKYDTQRISSDRIINLSYNVFKTLSEKQKVLILQESLPIYEQEHEVLLIEYDSKLVSYDNAPSLEFKGILSIIPLTETGGRLLFSKLNANFNILNPLDAKIYKAFTNNRNHILRLVASRKLCLLYNVSMPSDAFIADFQKATLFQLNDNSPSPYDSTLAHLINFNTTPSFIPEGNVEALIKSACVGMKKLDMKVDQVTRSKFYSFAIKHKVSINSISLFQAIMYIEDTIELFDDAKKGFNQLKETLSEKGKYDNAFISFSYFYYLKKEIEKSDYDISAPKNAILELIDYDPEVASRVLFMLGYTFSIQTISKSIQSFSKSELLKTQKNLNLEWTPKEIEQKIIEIPIQEKAKYKPGDIKIQDSNYLEDEKAIEIELSVENETDNKNLPAKKRIDKVKEPLNNPVDLFSDQMSSEHNQISPTFDISICNLKELKKNIGKGKFAKKIITALNDRNIDEDKISKELIINCLKEIKEYQIKNGKISANAKKVLKVFENIS